jgi:hypothetical protein
MESNGFCPALPRICRVFGGVRIFIPFRKRHDRILMKSVIVCDELFCLETSDAHFRMAHCWMEDRLEFSVDVLNIQAFDEFSSLLFARPSLNSSSTVKADIVSDKEIFPSECQQDDGSTQNVA